MSKASRERRLQKQTQYLNLIEDEFKKRAEKKDGKSTIQILEDIDREVLVPIIRKTLGEKVFILQASKTFIEILELAAARLEMKRTKESLAIQLQNEWEAIQFKGDQEGWTKDLMQRSIEVEKKMDELSK